MKKLRLLLSAALSVIMLISSGCAEIIPADSRESLEASVLTSDFPPYAGQPYVSICDDPFFSEDELTDQSFESYGELDELGRCQTAFACIGTDIMPEQERGSIGNVTPSGWHTAEYPGVIEGKYLYNRCHLIGYQLSGENANEKNLITGTRYLNIQGMLPLENMVADYVTDSGNHVLYRVTPVFEGENLIASGVLMEALSVEDDGEGISFCVYAYNVQPGIEIDYATGESRLQADGIGETPSQRSLYILNTNTMKFHLPSCKNAGEINEKNKEQYSGTREEVLSQGYSPCKNCNP